MQVCFFIAIAMAIAAYQWVKHKGTKKGWERSSIIFLGGLLTIPVFIVTFIVSYGIWGQYGQETENAEIAAKRDAEDLFPDKYAQNHHNPSYECKEAISSLAKYDFKWNDSMMEPAFNSYSWIDTDTKVIEMYGDRAQVQNGFGAYKKVKYSCRFNGNTGEIISYDFN